MTDSQNVPTREEANERIRQDLEYRLDQARTKRLSILEDMTASPYNTVYSLRWGDELFRQAWQESVYAELLSDGSNADVDLIDRLIDLVRTYRAKLLNDDLRGNSTSAFSNACDHTERSLLVEFIRTTGWHLKGFLPEGILDF